MITLKSIMFIINTCIFILVIIMLIKSIRVRKKDGLHAIELIEAQIEDEKLREKNDK